MCMRCMCCIFQHTTQYHSVINSMLLFSFFVDTQFPNHKVDQAKRRKGFFWDPARGGEIDRLLMMWYKIAQLWDYIGFLLLAYTYD